MLPFFLFDSVPDILWLCLLGLVYLSWIEVRREPDLIPQAWAMPVILHPDSARRAVEASLDLIGSL